MEIVELFDQAWRQTPFDSANLLGASRWTYHQAGVLSCELAAALREEAGLDRGDRVVVFGSPDGPVSRVGALAACRAELAWLVLDVAASSEHNEALIGAADGRLLLFDAPLTPQVARMRPRLWSVRHYLGVHDCDRWGWIDALSLNPVLPRQRTAV